MRSRTLPASPWRYVWDTEKYMLVQVPTTAVGALFSLIYHLYWVTCCSVALLALVAVLVWKTYALHGQLLASQRRLAEAEQKYRASMVGAGAPDWLVDQLVAHLNDGDVAGAHATLTNYLEH